jgi:hypothetical protein
MTLAGTIASNLQIKLLQKCHERFMNFSYNVTPGKKVMAMFISTNCRTTTVRRPPSEASLYTLNHAGEDGLMMRIKGNPHIVYLFNVRTGNVYVLERMFGHIDARGKPWEFQMSTHIFPGAPFHFLLTILNSRGAMKARVIRGK